MYTVLFNGHIRNDLTNVIFLQNESLVEYRDYLNWLSQGNTPIQEQNPMLTYVPPSVTARQARLALLEVGLLDDVELIVQNESRAVQLEWEYATTIQRDNPLLSLLNLSESQIDQLFIRANNL